MKKIGYYYFLKTRKNGCFIWLSLYCGMNSHRWEITLVGSNGQHYFFKFPEFRFAIAALLSLFNYKKK